MASKAVPRRALRAERGAPVVLVEGVDELWHLPAKRNGRTLCGLIGLGYVYSEVVARRRLCAVCGERAPRGDVYTAAGEFVRERRPRRPPPTRVPQLTDAQARVLYGLYVSKGLGVPTLARLVWTRLGYANERSCQNAINRAFAQRGYELRSRAAPRRTAAGKRMLGFGGDQAYGARQGERTLDARTVDRLYALYRTGHSVPVIAARFHGRFGYESEARFRHVLEYAWKVCGYKLRTNREAELLARARLEKLCAATTSGADGRRPRACTQRPLDDSDYCLHHDPRHRADVERRAAALRARKPLKPKIAWAELVPHLEPLLETRPDRFGRRLETASGALARNTGIDPAIAARLLKHGSTKTGGKPEITIEYADRLLAPLRLTVDDIQLSEQLAA